MVIIIKKTWLSVCLLLLLFLFFVCFSEGSDTISPGQSLSGNQTLISAEGIFELGFFTPGNSRSYYIGIWYKSFPDKTVVWVANRKTPVSDPSSSAFKLLEDGNLVLLNQSGATIWSTNLSSNDINSTTAQLLDNANFVLRNALDSSSTVLWQSFDHPTDHWIPGSKIGYNKRTDQKQNLVSWTSPENPAPSIFSIEAVGSSHVLLWNETKQYWTSGEWTGKIFTLVPEIQTNPYVTNMTYVSNENESYLTYASAIPNTLTRFVLNASGQYNQFVWRSNFDGWRPLWARPTQQCEVYAFCGPYSICDQQQEPLCACLEGFEPKMAKGWELGDHTGGCARRVPLQCDDGEKDKFLVMPNIRFTESSKSLAVDTFEDCEFACLSNCSCNAFAYDNGCLIWEADIYNLEQLASNSMTGRHLHLRSAASDWVGTRGKAKRNTTLIVCTTIAAFITLFALVLVILWKRRSASDAGSFKAVEHSLVLFKHRDLRSATKNFSEKLGEGGFGTVYRGTLPNSTAIAVKEHKRLKQCEKQFRAEVQTIGIIQHINLVRLCGFCAEASKRFLVYEYMPNGSLESLLFRKSPRILDWQSRFRIATGTARGLAYLHEECRDCIIHCDIKPENILLDAEYNPKVADFGLAKLFGRDFSRVLTTMRGTRGYLAPEWISGEAITTKADVFSYGMLLFEVISGRRNLHPLLDEGFDDYFPLRVANTIYQGKNVLTLLDDRLEGNVIVEELIRACKVACWCIQDDEKDRPTMGQVIGILEGLLEMGMPPFTRFFQLLQDGPAKSRVHLEISSSDSRA
ncbi:G-type lectin S-receptor-like serine/threonine-protein kinase At2g19130 [Pistacia vera]|uniref:G-type lectin S-receptor-like serine/threonine-protein kinase At2g19130 n=1 Tax=Pistacia vera TaxID=55513 RepID=UPI001263CF86|nr:G-type lectin S-receptor-like serine/threonine-protein kinase At2g19130 [Pistacia vera]